MSTLYIVSTPIGNLSDITLRAIEILKSVDLIAAEDTRHSQRLLSHYEIHTRCISLHDFNEDARIEKIISLLSTGKSVALISDAGTPLISDPGFRLVRAVQQNGCKVVPIPGACAAIAALSASGLPTDRFCFEGFLPAKKAALESRLQALKDETRTMIFYESVHRVVTTLSVMKSVFGAQRVVTLARELTKAFETIYQNTLEKACEWIECHAEQQKGEFVIVVSGLLEADIDQMAAQRALTQLLTTLLDEVTVKQAVSIACKMTGSAHRDVYALALKLKEGSVCK